MKRSIIIITALAFAGCATPVYVTNWKHIETGMTKKEVRNLIGEPHSSSAPLDAKVTASFKTDNTNMPPELIEQGAKLFLDMLFDRTHERWVYGQDSFIGPPPKGFSVYFDEKGEVIGYRRPTKGRFWNLPKEDKQPTTSFSIFPD